MAGMRRVVAGLLVVALAPLTLVATAAPGSAATGGTVVGRVTADEWAGVGLGDITVEAYRRAADGALTLVATDLTNIDGGYKLPNLPAGDYLLHFEDESDVAVGYTYLSEWWSDAADAATATVTQVTDGVTQSAINPSLAFATHMFGTVAGPDGNGRDDVEVVAYRKNPATSTWDEQSRTVTEADGDFRLDDLREGTYRFAFVDSELGTEYWTKRWQDFRGDVRDIALADDWAVPAESSMIGPSAQLGIPADIRDGQLVHVSPAEIQGVPEVGETLYGDPGSWFPLPERVTYEWLADGVPIPGAIDSQYVPVASDLGATLQLKVTASRFGSTNSTAFSPVTAPVAPELGPAPWDTVPPQIVGRPRVGAPVTVTPGVWTMPEATFSYQWEVDGVPVPGATGARYTPAPADVGKKLRAMVTASVPGHADGQSRAVTTYLVQPGQITPTSYPRIKGRAERGRTLVLDTGSWNAADATVTVQWYAGRDPIRRATDTTLSLTQKHARKQISVRINVSAPGYRAESVTLNAPGRVKRAGLTTAPVNTWPPSITGEPYVGDVLTADPGGWSASGPVRFTYEWYVVDQESPFPVSTASTYTPVPADAGKRIWVRVTAVTDWVGSSANSARTAPVAVHPEVFLVSPPTIAPLAAKPGTPIVATTGTWSEPDATLSFQWLVDGAPVLGATGTSYTPTSADATKTLQVRVTATKPGYRDGTATSEVIRIGWADIRVSKRPELTGVAARGATLRLDLGEWTPTDTAVEIQWYSGNDPLPWATSTKLKLVGRTAAAVLGKRIKVEINMTPPGAPSWMRQYVLFAPGRVT